MSLKTILLLCLTLAPAFACTGKGFHFEEVSTRGYQLSDAYARTSRPPHANSAAFLELKNLGDEPISIVNASTPRAGVTELHTMIMENDTMKMRRVDSIEIPSGETAVLKPGSDHLMFFELDGAWEVGQKIPILVELNDGAKIDFEVEVREL